MRLRILLWKSTNIGNYDSKSLHAYQFTRKSSSEEDSTAVRIKDAPKSWCASKTVLSVEDWENGLCACYNATKRSLPKTYRSIVLRWLLGFYYATWNTSPYQSSGKVKCDAMDYLDVFDKAGVQNLQLIVIEDNCLHRAGIVNNWKTDNGVKIMLSPASRLHLHRIED